MPEPLPSRAANAPRPPRIWPAILLPILAACVAAVLASAVLGALAVRSIGVEGVTDRPRFMQWVSELGATQLGFLMIILPGQLTFFVAALLGGALSRERPVTQRLGLTRPAMPWWAVPLLLLATPFASVCGDLLTTRLFGERPSENLQMLYGLFRGHRGVALVFIIVLVSVLPGFSEELLFRGYLQRRLLQRWHPLLAIGLASVMFAGAHLDPMHVVGVWPLGIWLGVLAWLTRSVWPSMICHTANNALAVIVTNVNPDASAEHIRLDAPGITAIAITGGFALLSIVVLGRFSNQARSEVNPSPVVPIG